MLIIIAHPSKSSPKAQKILLKFIQNPPKSLPNRVQNRYWIPNAFQNRPERDFFDFLLIFGAPRASQNRAKIMKNRKKAMKNRCQENTWLSTPFFLDFSWFWPPQTSPKSRFFRICFEDVDFLKISKNH